MRLSFIRDDNPCHLQCDLESAFIHVVSMLPIAFACRIRNP